jgi:hypothetical protein
MSEPLLHWIYGREKGIEALNHYSHVMSISMRITGRRRLNDRMDMSQVQFAPTVSDDIRLAQKMLISGEWVGALSGQTLPVYDPADGRMIVEVPEVWVNCYQAADSALPFGGTKESGWGRETCRETLEEYLETKTVVVSL